MPEIIPYIHIGLPKAASTSLQKNLFCHHPEINYFSKKDERYKPFYDQLIFTTDPDYKRSEVMDYYEKNIKPNLIQGMANILSNESIASPGTDIEPQAKLKRINNIIPHAKIILIIRNQIDFLRSVYEYMLYCQLGDNYHARLNEADLSDFNDWVRAKLDSDNRAFLKGLDYFDLIETCCNLYGQENINIILFEDIAEDLHKVAEELSVFLEISSQASLYLMQSKRRNQSRSVNYIKYLKFRRKLPVISMLTRLMPENQKRKIENKLNAGKRMSFIMSDKNKDIVSRLYRESNHKLAREYSLGLQRYGYPW